MSATKISAAVLKPSPYPKVGDPAVVTESAGYRLHQDRPYDCRYGCKCGSCNGTVTEYAGTVDDVVFYADNSVEARVLCEDGVVRIQHLVAPHGDPC